MRPKHPAPKPPPVIPADELEKLSSLERKAREFAELCNPDFLCERPQVLTQVKFAAIDLDDRNTGLSGPAISLQIEGVDHLFTDWSRHQLLQHLGTKEKWFDSVTLADQARELTRRVHTFDKHVFRTMRTYEDINFVRGLLSAKFKDIPDLEVIEALAAILPDGECLTRYSGKSDRTFFAYTMTRASPLGIGQSMIGYPGAIVKNSEVGSTALIVIPFFLVVHPSGFMRPVALRKEALLRQIHRGQAADLRQALRDALSQLQAIWAPLHKRLDKLLERTFPDEDAAIAKLEEMLTWQRLSKRFIQKASTTYRDANNTAHNGLTLFTAVLAACGTGHLDSRYDDAEVAGYLLLQLL